MGQYSPRYCHCSR
jgi:hypothetical protein